MIIEKAIDSYAGHFKYIDQNIHNCMEKHTAIELMMNILVKEMPQYSYSLKFSVVNGLFINELIITDNGIKREGDTRDTLRDEIKEDVDRGDCGFAI